jgi:lipopolysaccharide biosynthesis glycosyltransferase
MKIVYCINDTGHEVLMASLRSLDNSGMYEKYIFFDSRCSYKKFLKHNYEKFVPIIFEDLNEELKELYVAIPKKVHSLLPEATYLRLILPFIFKSESFLYLDFDTLVLRDIRNEFNDLKQGHLYAVRDEGIGLGYSRNIGLKSTHVYFNAGVLYFHSLDFNQYKRDLLNFIRMIEEEVLDRDFFLHDQDILNYVLSDYQQLPSLFNYQTNYFIKDCYMSTFELNEREIAILHFVGPCKPWNYPTYRYFKKFHRAYYSQIERKFSMSSLKFILRFNGVVKYFN